ncbi:conserved hypothetical protein [delta proteobacterium NaphS2]|nr:conserved hypothetical protein [delta proteobacterium NaphS2]
MIHFLLGVINEVLLVYHDKFYDYGLDKRLTSRYQRVLK